MARYANPEMLVETDWVKANLGEPHLRLVEIDVHAQGYDAGHPHGAVGFDRQNQLQDQVRRHSISKEAFEKLVGGAGISPKHTVILYGDNNNWFAAYGLWLFKIYGHADVKLMNGGRQKWLNEPDKELTTDLPSPKPGRYQAKPPDLALRARVAEVMEASQKRAQNLVDV